MTKALNFLNFLGGCTELLKQTIHEIFTPSSVFKLTMQQLYEIGVRSLPLVFIIIASTGMVMTIQFDVGLEKFGGRLYVPKVISLSIARELGPVFACLMLAARVGAGITSELGSMRVTQQIDAIRALGTSPVKKIVLPRVLASMIAIPLLSGFAILFGIMAAMFISILDLSMSPSFFLQKVFSTVLLADYFSGMLKTPFFALFISVTACYYGLTVKAGTQAVGLATTRSVVSSCIFVMVGDFFLTKLFVIIEGWLK